MKKEITIKLNVNTLKGMYSIFKTCAAFYVYAFMLEQNEGVMTAWEAIVCLAAGLYLMLVNLQYHINNVLVMILGENRNRPQE